MNDDTLTRAERTDLQKVARMRARVARGGLEAAKAARLAEFESELLAEYPPDHEAWAELTAEGNALVARLDAELAARCEALGIRPEFRPGLSLSWYRRGENAADDRRAELRRLAKLELEARGKAARQQIDAAELEAVTAIVAVGLGSQARELLESMPTADELVGNVDLGELESKARPSGELRAVGGGVA